MSTGLEHWERQIIDSAALYRSVLLEQTLPMVFAEQLRALWVLDTSPERVDQALQRLHADIRTAADHALEQAREQARHETGRQAG